jgi:hypothetical protein
MFQHVIVALPYTCNKIRYIAFDLKEVNPVIHPTASAEPQHVHEYAVCSRDPNSLLHVSQRSHGLASPGGKEVIAQQT